MKIASTASLAAALTCGCLFFTPLASSQAGSAAAENQKARVTITDDNLSENLPAKPAGDEAQPDAPAAQPALTADDIAALEKSVAEKRADLKDLEDSLANAKLKAEQESDQEQKNRLEVYIQNASGTDEALKAELAAMEKKLVDAKASAASPATDDPGAAQPDATGDTRK
jgi:chromosome segregation ATPase